MKLTFIIPAMFVAALATAQQTYVDNSGSIGLIYNRKAESQKASGSQYFNEKFMPASINEGEVQVVRHNAYSDEMEVKVLEEIKVLQPENGQIVKLHAGGPTYEYVQYTDDKKVEHQSYLILVSDNPNLKIYKKEQVILVPEQHPVGPYDKYKAPMYKQEKPTYYIKIKNGDVVFFETDKSGVLSLFPEKKNEIKDFMKENKISPSDEEDLPELGAYLSTIL